MRPVTPFFPTRKAYFSSNAHLPPNEQELRQATNKLPEWGGKSIGTEAISKGPLSTIIYHDFSKLPHSHQVAIFRQVGSKPAEWCWVHNPTPLSQTEKDELTTKAIFIANRGNDFNNITLHLKNFE